MFPDPTKLNEVPPRDILEAAATGHLGIDQRMMHALADRWDVAGPAVVEFSRRDRSDDAVDLAPELVALFRHTRSREAIPFLIDYIKESPDDVPDETVETLVALGGAALEPLLKLHRDLDESENGEVAFILANLRTRDDRILRILVDRLDYDLSDGLLLLSLYGDPAAAPAIHEAAENLDKDDTSLRKEVNDALTALRSNKPVEPVSAEDFNLWSLYPEEADLPLDLLDEDARAELLRHAVPSVRAAAANSFFNRDLTDEQRTVILALATGDESAEVRARAWESLTNSTEDAQVVEAMLAALRHTDQPVEERGGLLVGLAPESDRNEVRKAITDLYQIPEGRAKALEAMWRSVHPSFREYFAKHLNDGNVEVRRSAIWGVGYFGIKSEMERIRKLFDDEELRSDALFAYTLLLPGEISRGRVKSLLARVEKDARGLSEGEEELVKAALDERLLLSGKEPVFSQMND